MNIPRALASLVVLVWVAALLAGAAETAGAASWAPTERGAAGLYASKGVLRFTDRSPSWSPDAREVAFARPVAPTRTRQFLRQALYTASKSGRDSPRRLAEIESPTWMERELEAGPEFAWSPSSQMIAFEFPYLLPVELRVVRRDGSRLWRMSGNGSYDWSPDSETIAFPGRNGILLADAKGGWQKRITEGDDSQPQWSPDGTRIGFVRVVETFIWGRPVYDITLRVVRPGESRDTVVAGSGTALDFAGWSPDGKAISFVTWEEEPGETDNFHPSVVAQWVDGSGRYVNAAGDNPVWSPGSDRLAVERSGGVDILSTSGAVAGRIAAARNPMWSPDGRRIAFIRGTTLYVARSDGTHQTRLRHARQFSWSPDGRRIAVAGEGCSQDRAGIWVVDVLRRRSSRLTRPDFCTIVVGDKNRASVGGTPRRDLIYGGESRDVIRSGRGDDAIFGDVNRDQIFAGPGNDSIFANGDGTDLVSCGAGTDHVVADRRDRIALDCERVVRR